MEHRVQYINLWMSPEQIAISMHFPVTSFMLQQEPEFCTEKGNGWISWFRTRVGER